MFNPLGMPRPKSIEATIQIEHQGQSHDLVLRELDTPLEMMAVDLAGQLMKDYAGVNGEPPAVGLIPIEGGALQVSQTLAQICARMFYSQSEANTEKYEPKQILAMAAVMPASWRVWMEKIAGGFGENDEGND